MQFTPQPPHGQPVQSDPFFALMADADRIGCDLTPSMLADDETYTITERRIPLNDFTVLCQAGELQDASAVAALCLFRIYLTRSDHPEVWMGSVEESDKL